MWTAASGIRPTTDRDPTTFWRTETYLNPFHKPGVGLVLDLGAAVAAKKLRLSTDAPGFTAEILAGAAPTGPFSRVAAGRTTAVPTTVFKLTEASSSRYLVVWVTALAGGTGEAHVNDVVVLG